MIALAFTITVGWWILPALITLLSFIAFVFAWRDDYRSGSGGYLTGLETFIALLIAVAMSSMSWLLYVLICRV